VPVAAGELTTPAVHATSTLVAGDAVIVATELMAAAVASTLAGHVVDVMIGLPESVFIVTSPFVAHTTLPSQFLAMA
jgi:hypothetical protein